VQASAARSRVALCTCACFCCKMKGTWNSSYQKEKTMRLCFLLHMHICFCPKIKGACIYLFEMMLAASAIQFIQTSEWETTCLQSWFPESSEIWETLETSKLHNLQTRDPQVSTPLTRSSRHKPNSTSSMENISLHAVMWAWQLWICLDSIYLFATWTLVSVVVGTTQIQSWRFFWTNLQLCFQFTPILRGFFLGQTRLLAAWNWRGSKLSGSFSYFPNSKCTAPCMLKLMWELWIWHFSCWS
jgi:hypothetical protein